MELKLKNLSLKLEIPQLFSTFSKASFPKNSKKQIYQIKKKDVHSFLNDDKLGLSKLKSFKALKHYPKNKI